MNRGIISDSLGTVYTVHQESIHSASLIPYYVMLQPYSKMDYICFLPQNSTYNTPVNTKKQMQSILEKGWNMIKCKTIEVL